MSMDIQLVYLRILYLHTFFGKVGSRHINLIGFDVETTGTPGGRPPAKPIRFVLPIAAEYQESINMWGYASGDKAARGA